MIRKVFKKKPAAGRFDAFLQKYNLPPELFATNRRAVTRALLVGLFLALLPIPGQMVAVVLLTPFFRFNVLLALGMVWLTNPVTMPFIYYSEYEIGRMVLMQAPLPEMQISVEWFRENFTRIVLPLYMGSLFLSTGVSLLAYAVTNRLWVRSVKKAQAGRNYIS
jgi:uncharacterized protein (DUF2062 family)